jgi:hypothetical protein
MTRIFLSIPILVIFFLLNYFVTLNQKHNIIIEDAQKINSVLEKHFKQAGKTLTEIGLRISKENPKLKLDVIHEIFVETSKAHPIDLYSWTLFNWVDTQGYQKVNTIIGIRKDKIRASNRNYRSRTNQDWKLIFSKRDFGHNSKILVIPIGMQISTSKFPRAGTVAVGIDIKKLTSFISKNLDKDVRFAIIDDRDNSLAFESNDADEYFEDLSFKKLDFIDDKLFFSQKMDEKYPYSILTKYDRRRFWSDFLLSSTILLIQLLATVSLAFFIQKKINKKKTRKKL